MRKNNEERTVTSMTGYAYGEGESGDVSVSVEIKSVNARFSDITINLPPYLNRLEKRFRDAIAKKVVRGKVDVAVRVKEANPDCIVTADEMLAKFYARAISNIASAVGVKEDGILPIVVSQPGVLKTEIRYDMENYWNMISPVFTDCLAAFCRDREREGENLARDVSEKLETLFRAAAFFKKRQGEMESLFKKQITQKFNELLGEHVDEQRIMSETAAMIVKYTINEEIVRLESHLEALKNEMRTSAAPGKKIDFLCQEINREINTIGSKSQFADVSAEVIAAKDALENIREQARNIE